MAVPKKRTSHARKRKRHTHDAISPTRWVVCPQCREPMQLHRICKACGYYRSKEVVPQA